MLLAARHLAKYFGPDPVLEDVEFEIRSGDRIALVGPNGAGKSTLLNILCGRLDADRGTVDLNPAARLGYLEQHAQFAPEDTVWSVATAALGDLAGLAAEAERVAELLATADDDDERRRLGDRFDHLQQQLLHHDAYSLEHRIDRVLAGLGFPESTRQQPARTLSGGQQNRLSLACLLLAEPDLMLLDEPSNHLDIAGTEWLESFLNDCRSAVLVVSHDRYFLDRVATRTFELCHGTVDSYPGNYSAYCRQKAERLEVQRRTYERQQSEIAKLEDFIRRNHYGQKSAQAEDRRKKLERIERVPPPREIPTPPMGFPPASRTGDIVLRCERLTKGFGDRPLFRDLTFDVLRGEKWGILGPNGSGKTTLLRCLVGELPLDDGRIVLGSGVRLGYFDQLLRCVPDDAPALEAIRPGHKEFVLQQRRDMLARFGLVGDQALQQVGSFSGGERNRTALAMLAASDANLLVLDEPTNHLDLWSRGALEATLRKFDGSVVLVSHDRYFLNQVVDHLLVVEPDRFRVFEGNYDTFQHFVRQGLAQEASTAEPTTAKREREETPDSRRKPASTPKKTRKFPRRKPEDIEREIAECEAKIAALHNDLADPAVLRDGGRVKQVKAALDERQQALARLYEHWEEAVDS